MLTFVCVCGIFFLLSSSLRSSSSLSRPARVEARIQDAEDNLFKKKTIKKSALEIAYDATLESFTKQSERCWNCKLFYSADENDDSSCK